MNTNLSRLQPLPASPYQGRSNQAGLTIIDTLTAAFVISTAFVAVVLFGLMVLRLNHENRRRTEGLGLLSERTEAVRALTYRQVGYVDAGDGEPPGVLVRQETVERNRTPYDVSTSVELVDDPDNGTLGGPVNENTADYKKVTVGVVWNSPNGRQSDVKAVTLFSRGAKYRQCTPGEQAVCPGTVSPGVGACLPYVNCPASGVCPSEYGADPTCPPGAQYCPQCYVDSDCAPGYQCSITEPGGGGSCVTGGSECYENSHCGSGQVCENGSCQTSCTGGRTCAGDTICNTNTGVCTLPCSNDSCGCEPGYTCGTDDLCAPIT